ncbi:hypothetical protein Moror_6177 [Moniliophthora roreri MCA 2997]|uniref:Uncharacterized protein n=2 Tax=Moniliophthora roreri TaxID=221103 RepID=V2WSC0_MONRO|nr:hypothetical protein Moror_6177 [Moniliophthora roreri MCA 2997]
MRAQIRLFEDPSSFSSDDIWDSKVDGHKMRAIAWAGAVSLVSATFAIIKFTSLGRTFTESAFGKQLQFP